MPTKGLMAKALVVAATLFWQPGAWPQSGDSASVPAVTDGELAEVREALRGLGLHAADVVRGGDGRLTLSGEYENRDQVESAFAVARAVLGLRRVAPTTPAQISYRLKGFDNAFAAQVGDMMKKAPKPASPSPMTTPLTTAPLTTAPLTTAPLTTAPLTTAPLTKNSPTTASPTTASPNSPRAATPRTLGLIVGVGKFKNLPLENRLEFANKDATDFHRFLVKPDGGGLSAQWVSLLSDENATAKAVQTALTGISQQAQSGDTVILFIASHGVPNAMNKFDILLHDSEFPLTKAGGRSSIEFANANRNTVLTDDNLQNFVATLVAKQVRTILVIDACYSGKTFAKIPGYLPTRTRALDSHQREVAYSASPSGQAISELVQQASRDIKTARIVIVSASEGEEAIEFPEIGGGVFTQMYINSLSRLPDFADAFDQAKPAIVKRARTVGHSQTPRLLVVPETAHTRIQ